MNLKRDILSIGLFCLVYSILALFIDNSYYLLLMTIVPIWAMMGMSWNLFSGYSGLISFGHAAFFGLGAYLVAILLGNWNVSPWIGVPLAGVLGGLAAALVGIPTFRLRGHYFALAMLAYPLALLYIFEWLGFQELALPMKREAPALFMQFENQHIYVFIALFLLAMAMVVTSFLSRSRFGMSLLALKQDEEAAEASGINTHMWKVFAIAISGALAGVAGGFYAVVLLVVTPLAVFGMLVSAQALVIAMFGGVGTLWGPIIGAFILVPLSEILYAQYAADFPGIQGVIYGVAIMTVILVAPEGVIWKIKTWLRPKQARVIGATTCQLNTLVNEDILAVEQSDIKTNDILKVENLSKAFGGLKAIQNLSFSVQQGELLGVIGPNGAGKTTLFNLLNGFQTPDAGTVTFRDKPLKKLRPNKICHLGVARTFQVPKPFTRISVFDNVVVGAYVRSRTNHEASELASAALKLVGLQALANSPAANLTNRELRLMELARALASKPALILVDEILAGLDSAATKAVVHALKKVTTLGITIVIIEHSMKTMVELVDRFIVLDHGALLTEGSPENIVKDEKVIEAYLGKKWLEANAEVK
ncbi:MAG: branched-chain amino acid ABC transporter [SAR86 cluster bacterium]|uniref:Branched-chain amino acid ABC transporter n=1 Tax=SAR86 cluster bacterium TaxID=2030880 RepID=A0A2A5C7C2_9GAMM|nr:MAG: branched-chain amino acid ABC transporter [SAR86 cluster bacterium]